MFDLIRSDIRRARQLASSEGTPRWRSSLLPLVHLGCQAVIIYRYGSWVRRLRAPILRHILLVPYYLLRIVQITVCQVSISSRAEIGPGFVVCKWGGVFVPSVKAGRNLYVASGVLIAQPVRLIGDNAFFSVGSKALGPITVGNNVTVGANAVVCSDVPDNTIVLSPSSRMISRTFFQDKQAVTSEGEAEAKADWVRANFGRQSQAR